MSITGDAPKDFVRLYQYKPNSVVRKANPKTWPLFLAKHGHKHYPMEAITEHLLNRIGEVYGFNMAESKLVWLGGQIRFLSKYFIKSPSDQILDHGADLYSGYLNDRDFVEEIEKLHKAPEFFTVRFTQIVFKYFFPEQHKKLMLEFAKLLVFDALIGNNDRHFYNWGIIRHIQNKHDPFFSQIYDTARGLFWNYHEDKLREIYCNKSRLNSFIKKYSDSSNPKIGWEGCKKPNHFELVSNLKTLNLLIDISSLKDMCDDQKIIAVHNMIDKEFSQLMSPVRLELIKMCLEYRLDCVKKILTLSHD